MFFAKSFQVTVIRTVSLTYKHIVIIKQIIILIDSKSKCPLLQHLWLVPIETFQVFLLFCICNLIASRDKFIFDEVLSSLSKLLKVLSQHFEGVRTLFLSLSFAYFRQLQICLRYFIFAQIASFGFLPIQIFYNFYTFSVIHI